MAVERHSDDLIQIGSCYYRHPKGAVNLGALALLAATSGWATNNSSTSSISTWTTGGDPDAPKKGIRWEGRAIPYHASGRRMRTPCKEASGPPGGTTCCTSISPRGCWPRRSAATRLPPSNCWNRFSTKKKDPLAEPARLVLSTRRDGRLPGRSSCGLPSAGRQRARDNAFPGDVAPIRQHRSRRCSTKRPATRFARRVSRLEPPRRPSRRWPTTSASTTPTAREYDELAGVVAEPCWLRYGAAHPVCYRAMRTFSGPRQPTRPRKNTCARLAAAAILDPPRRVPGLARSGGENRRRSGDRCQEYQWDDVVAFDDDVPDVRSNTAASRPFVKPRSCARRCFSVLAKAR